MRYIKELFITLFYGSLIGALVILFKPESSESQPLGPVYKFDNPDFASHLLNLLNSPPDLEDWYRDVAWPSEFGTFKLMNFDENYCDKVTYHFTRDPNFVLYEDNFFTEYSFNSSIVRELIAGTYIDLLPHIKPTIYGRKEQQNYPLDTVAIFTHSQFHFIHDVGKHFACFNQIYNHIPGLPSLQAKDLCVTNMKRYSEFYYNKPECFDLDELMPKTWIMYNEGDCIDFFENYFNTDEYEAKKKEQRIQYIRKIGDLHRAIGVEIVDEQEEINLREYYLNGKLCGEKHLNILIQKYISNPLLIMGRKFDFRIYMFVASTNPVIAYYHDGFLKLSLERFNHSSNEKNSFVSNTDLAKQRFEDARNGKFFEGMNETELREFQTWTLPRLQDYLLKEGIINDPDWLENYLRPKFKKTMAHFTRGTSYEWLKYSPLCELIGWDFTMDADLNVWFLEANWNPALVPYSQDRKILLIDMITDIFEIMLKYVRSRVKRIVNFVNEVSKQHPKGVKSISEFNMNLIMKEYEEISKNYLDPEYQIDESNSFEKIIDENMDGAESYGKIIPGHCL